MRINVLRTAGVISPLLFGHNLEHTRACVWRGLSAQLLRNRKFCGGYEREGTARHWHRVNPVGCLYMKESGWGWCGTQGDVYTEHLASPPGRARATMQAQVIRRLRRGVPCGVGQRGVRLERGREYEGRLAFRADRRLPVTLRILSGGRAVFETRAAAGAQGWTEHGFRFTSAVSDADARFEVTFTRPGALRLGAASLLPADHFQGMRRDVIELLKEISVPILRWPGGNFAGCYLWKDGLLPVDRRAPLTGGGILPYSDGVDEHEIGTNEFVALCREIGAQPWITINMSLEGPEEARQWVEYCNGAPDTEWGARRAALGHREPFGVKYWSLGNEMGYGHMKGPNTPREYGRAAAACARAMRRADPSVVLVASGTWWREEWFPEVLARHGKAFDHISYHEYTTLIKDYEGERGRGELRRLADAPGACALRALKGVRARADAHAGRFVGISFDEWNVWHTWFRVPGVAEGLHAAAMLNMFCREAERIGMTFGAYFEPVNEGAIWVEPDGARLTPAGRVFALFRAHQGNLRLVLPRRRGADLDIAASLDPRTRDVVLTVVNASADAGRSVEIELGSVVGIVRAQGRVLVSRDFLPDSEFHERRLAVRAAAGVLRAALPPLSVALLRVQRCERPAQRRRS